MSGDQISIRQPILEPRAGGSFRHQLECRGYLTRLKLEEGGLLGEGEKES